jgi:Leu/Phe-tRNA-protein transferase
MWRGCVTKMHMLAVARNALPSLSCSCMRSGLFLPFQISSFSWCSPKPRAVMKGECQDIHLSIHMLEFKEHSWYQFLGSNINFRCNYYSFIR